MTTKLKNLLRWLLRLPPAPMDLTSFDEDQMDKILVAALGEFERFVAVSDISSVRRKCIKDRFIVLLCNFVVDNQELVDQPEFDLTKLFRSSLRTAVAFCRRA